VALGRQFATRRQGVGTNSLKILAVERNSDTSNRGAGSMLMKLSFGMEDVNKEWMLELKLSSTSALVYT
jgi:hypothetical protein